MPDIIDNPGATGAAAATTAAATTAQPAAGAETLLGSQSAQTAAAGASLLGGAQTAAEQTAAAAAGTGDAWLPEKFRVMAGDQLDYTASAQKMSEAYTNLEKRFGAGDARPASADAYKFDLGEGFDTAAFLAAPGVQDFVKQAYDLGFNDKQLNFMVGEFIASQPDQATQATGITAAESKAQLQEHWKEPAVFSRNMLAADTAARSLLGSDYQGFIARYGNDPAIIKMLAVVGTEMSEDSLRLAGQPMLTADSVEDLMRSEAYYTETHPDHKRVTKMVRDHFQRTAGNVVIN